MGTQNNRLNETVLLSTQNICKIDGLENITLKILVYQNLWASMQRKRQRWPRDSKICYKQILEHEQCYKHAGWHQLRYTWNKDIHGLVDIQAAGLNQNKITSWQEAETIFYLYGHHEVQLLPLHHAIVELPLSCLCWDPHLVSFKLWLFSFPF